ncbi:MAG: hypothetical protein QOJ64_923 [Acidobacteriota bacterium]|jgi:hypothetical protein|nr:hypothetical protein [Acidobacteriota bacterium]
MTNFKTIITVFGLLFVTAVAAIGQGTPLVDVPINFRGPMPVLEVMINGKGPFLFTFDTGAGLQADFDPALVAQLKLQTNGKVRGGDPSGRNAQEYDTVAVDSIALGNVEFRNVTAISRRRRMSLNAPKVDGILGFSLFKEYLFTLDFPGKRLRLEHSELPEANGLDILNFDDPRHVPVIDLAVGRTRIKADIDSGNMMGGFVLPESLVNKLSLMSKPVTVGRAQTVNNEIEIKQAKLSDPIKFGRFEFSQPLITFPAIAEVANIGLVILQDFVLSFDQKNKRVRLERPAPRKETVALADVPPALKDYTGRYGIRAISFEEGALHLQRLGGPKIKLVAAGKDEFTLELVPTARVTFVRGEGGKVIEMRVLNRAGEWESSKKDQP